MFWLFHLPEYVRNLLFQLQGSGSLAGKSSILVGNKADLERSRVLQTTEGCDLAVEFALKFTETSPGMGHHIDELLVGIVMQMRLREEDPEPKQKHSLSKKVLKRIVSIVKGREEKKRVACKNLNIL